MGEHHFTTVAFPLLAAVGTHCSSSADGERVHRMIEALLNRGYSVTMDFQGVKIVSKEFYDAAVGDLDVLFPEDRLTSVNLPLESF
jgi:hypothetical protein